MLREKCNRPMLLIERQKAMLLRVYKCIHELGPRYRHGMFSQKSRATKTKGYMYSKLHY